jgi:AAA+ ATPase superfamily predicted ATPase
VLHDRIAEWEELARFAGSGERGALLGVVYGRRRQGKTLMLELLAEACEGFVFTGLQQSNPQNLRDLAEVYAGYAGMAGASFRDWHEGIGALLQLGERTARPLLVVLDEFPFLVDSAPELPSVIQRALSPRGRARRESMTRLILCGSALTTMRGLLAGSAPLRGRSRLELVVHPFGYRDAAQFWGAGGDPDLAFRLHALVGGTPAYLDMCGEAPAPGGDFGQWVVRHLLNPASAMFREGDVLLREESQVGDPALYHAVLGALCRGAHRRSEIAAVLGRPESSLAHAVSVLEHVRLVERIDDGLRQRRPVYRIADPLIRLHQLVIRPHEARLVARAGARVWAEAADTAAALIYGPHLETLARGWCLEHAAEQTLGGIASRVQPTVLACPQHRQGHELDVVVTEVRPFASDQVVAIGEVKATRAPVGDGELNRLEHLRGMLPPGRHAGQVRLLLFSRAGFTRALRESASLRGDVELIDLHRLYAGS